MRNTSQDEILDVLNGYMSKIMARSVLRRAVERVGVAVERMPQADVPRVIREVGDGARLFVQGERLQLLIRDLSRFDTAGAPPPLSRISIRAERDINEARMRAWQVAEQMGARRYTLQRVATIVSELARNIVSYTNGGAIEMEVLSDSGARLRIQASDHGPGIPHLDDVIGGGYGSRTGLGKGIVAVKRLSDRFDISTGATGTTVTAEVHL